MHERLFHFVSKQFYLAGNSINSDASFPPSIFFHLDLFRLANVVPSTGGVVIVLFCVCNGRRSVRRFMCLLKLSAWQLCACVNDALACCVNQTPLATYWDTCRDSSRWPFRVDWEEFKRAGELVTLLLLPLGTLIKWSLLIWRTTSTLGICCPPFVCLSKWWLPTCKHKTRGRSISADNLLTSIRRCWCISAPSGTKPRSTRHQIALTRSCRSCRRLLQVATHAPGVSGGPDER